VAIPPVLVVSDTSAPTKVALCRSNSTLQLVWRHSREQELWGDLLRGLEGQLWLLVWYRESSTRVQDINKYIFTFFFQIAKASILDMIALHKSIQIFKFECVRSRMYFKCSKIFLAHNIHVFLSIAF